MIIPIILLAAGVGLFMVAGGFRIITVVAISCIIVAAGWQASFNYGSALREKNLKVSHVYRVLRGVKYGDSYYAIVETPELSEEQRIKLVSFSERPESDIFRVEKRDGERIYQFLSTSPVPSSAEEDSM